MLYALLDDTMHAGLPSSPEVDEDRATVSRFVSSISARLQALRKKIVAVAPPSSSGPASAARSGATTAVVGSPATTSSPSSHPSPST